MPCPRSLPPQRSHADCHRCAVSRGTPASSILSGNRPLSRQGQHCAGTRAAHVQLLSAKTLSVKPVPGEFWDSDFMSNSRYDE